MTEPITETFPVDETFISAAEEEESDPTTGEIMTLPRRADLELKRGRSAEEVVTHIANLKMRRELELEALTLKHKRIIEMMGSERTFLQQQIEACDRAIRIVMPPITGDEAYTNDSVSLFYTETIETEVTDADAVPIEFCEVKTVTTIKKSEAKEAILAGEEVPGIALKKNNHLQVKKGGARALANAKKREVARRKRLAERVEQGVVA